jgi:hypothetical protein
VHVKKINEKEEMKGKGRTEKKYKNIRREK